MLDKEIRSLNTSELNCSKVIQEKESYKAKWGREKKIDSLEACSFTCTCTMMLNELQGWNQSWYHVQINMGDMAVEEHTS